MQKQQLTPKVQKNLPGRAFQIMKKQKFAKARELPMQRRETTFPEAQEPLQEKQKPKRILGTQWRKWWAKSTLQLLSTLCSYMPCLQPHLPVAGSLFSSFFPVTLPATIWPPPCFAFTKTVLWETAGMSTKGLKAFWEARWSGKSGAGLGSCCRRTKQGSCRKFAGTADYRFWHWTLQSCLMIIKIMFSTVKIHFCMLCVHVTEKRLCQLLWMCCSL